MLSHLLARAGVDTVVIDIRDRETIQNTHRAGILEQPSVDALVNTGVSDRVLRDGTRHAGIELAFGGGSHRIDFEGLVGAGTQLYPQTDVFIDLADAGARDGGDVRFGVSDVSVGEVDTARPVVRFTDAGGSGWEVRCEYLVGADGSRSVCRDLVPEPLRVRCFREYPFAWFGILCEAPPSAAELVYNHSSRGFALISQRTPTLQRMYFQCDPGEDPAAWSDQRIWDELGARVGANGLSLRAGPITSRSVLPFRSLVQEPAHYARLALVGDAAHTVPPTGAKGLNLALADVLVLAEVLPTALTHDDPERLAEYGARALARVWKAQHFSYWMTGMLHLPPEADVFDRRRQEAELASVTESVAGSTYLAQGYTGWPGRR